MNVSSEAIIEVDRLIQEEQDALNAEQEAHIESNEQRYLRMAHYILIRYSLQNLPLRTKEDTDAARKHVQNIISRTVREASRRKRLQRLLHKYIGFNDLSYVFELVRAQQFAGVSMRDTRSWLHQWLLDQEHYGQHPATVTAWLERMVQSHGGWPPRRPSAATARPSRARNDNGKESDAGVSSSRPGIKMFLLYTSLYLTAHSIAPYNSQCS